MPARHRLANTEFAGALDGALKRVAASQEANGGFTTLIASSRTFNDSISCATVFECALIASLLHHVDHSVARGIIANCRHYLAGQLSPEGSLNYWPLESSLRQKHHYPDDMDDVACAMTAFFADPDTDDHWVSSFVKLLLTIEEQPGGPYRSWVVAKDDAASDWQDVDIAVNANIAYALSLLGVLMPILDDWIGDRIAVGDLQSRYYPQGVSVQYFIARSYRGQHAERLADLILTAKSSEGLWPDTVQTAQAVASLVRLGRHEDVPNKAVQHLIAAAYDSQSQPVWEDPALHRGQGYAGSPALTAAFIAEALWLYGVSGQLVEADSRRNPSFPAAVDRRLELLPFPLLKDAIRVELLKLYRGSSSDIIGVVPRVIAAALGDGARVPMTVVEHASAASIWGWLAYTIYDDFLDRDAAVAPELLSVAHWSARAMQDEFLVVAKAAPRFGRRIDLALTRIDTANYWEVDQARAQLDGDTIYINYLPNYGSYGQLAERSIGHALAGLAVLDCVNAPDADVDCLERYFYHYLIARQLSDDAHDWEDDLRQGQLSAVVVLGLADYGLPSDRSSVLQLSDVLPELQQSMWMRTMPRVSVLIEQHCAQARTALAAITCFASTEQLERLLVPIERSAQEAMRHRRQTLDFISEF